MGLFSEFKERHLFRIVAAYAAGGWIVLSGVDQLVDREVLPRWVYLVALVWFGAGFLGAIVLGWYHGEKGRQKATVNEIALLSGLLIAALLISASVVQRDASRSGPLLDSDLDPRRIAVLYFNDRSQDESLGFVADGLTESLIDALAEVQGLSVVSENGSAQFIDSDALPDSVGRALDVGTVVEGTVRRDGDRIRVDVSVADGVSGAEFRSATFERPADRLDDLQEGLANEVSQLLRGWLGEEISVRTASGETGSSTAWAALQRGERERKRAMELRGHGDVNGFLTAAERADSLYALAAAEDPEWARPWIQRAELTIRHAQVSAGDPLEARDWIDAGLLHAERALGVDARSAGAYEKRGMLKYVRWALGLEADPVRAERLLAGAEEDLGQAVNLDPTRANAWNVLSILHSQKPDPVESKLAARRAYEADAFLDVAHHVLYGLYETSYDLEQFPDAVQYCAEGRRRFPDDWRFYDCELWLLASRALDPDIDRAWALRDSVVALAPDHLMDYKRLESAIVVGGVLARAGLADSAHAVFDRVRSDPDMDASGELQSIEAVFRIQMGETSEAIDLIRRYLSANPTHREGWQWSSHWWWRPLRDEPDFLQLVGAGT